MRSWIVGLLVMALGSGGCSEQNAETDTIESDHQTKDSHSMRTDSVLSPARSTDINNLPKGRSAEVDLLASFCAATSESKDGLRTILAKMQKSEGPDFKLIEIGEIASSSLTDTIVSEIYGENWMFFVCKSFQHLSIEMKSYSIDPALLLGRGITANESEVITQDDDSGEGLDAQITIWLPMGIYRIIAIANSSIKPTTGSYTLSVRER